MTIIVRYPHENEIDAITHMFGDVVTSALHYNALARVLEQKKYSYEEFERRYKEDHQSLLVAEDSETRQLTGICITSFDSFLLWIDWVCVHPQYQKQGIAKRLVEFAEQRARSLGYYKIWCESLVDNEPSLRVFEALGFRRSEVFRKHWYGQDYCFLEKPLVRDTGNNSQLAP